MARSAPAQRSCKPEAPVAIEVATRTVGDELEVTARATPTADVGSLELALVLPAPATSGDPIAARFGATPAGQERRLVARMRADGRSSSVTAIARVPASGIDMSRTATIAIGAPVAPPVVRVYALPDGDRARELVP
ncbi:MAG: hypothetical protein H0T46_00515 [Deltaproteobacteria bacterium]|nr:hypothetical protein [Deltaproteobacteria bacterium]